LIGLTALMAGALLSAAAPTFAALAAAQVVVGGGLAVVLSGAVAAAAAWSSDEERATVLSWTLVGQPGAWIVALPVVGLVGDASWRLALIAGPGVTGALALLAVGTRPSDQPSEPGSGSWLLLRQGLST
jgi:MFS transporter, DHA1 family, inner membrane transport protein